MMAHLPLIPSFFASFIFFLAEYLTQLEWEEERERQELSATEEFDRGGQKASTVPANHTTNSSSYPSNTRLLDIVLCQF